MTHTDPFQDFDPSRYLTVSNLTLQSMVTLTKALVAAKPEDAPDRVEHLAALLSNTATEAEAAMIVRLREYNLGGASADLLFDNAVDPLWSLLRDRLIGWGIYERDGLDFLQDDVDAPPEVDIEELRDKAARAGEINERLFGTEGVKFVQRPYIEQAQLMANILGLIDTDDLGDDLIELTGPELLPLLRHCQNRYEVMVQARSMREGGSAADLRTLRNQLRRFITRYAGAVITMLDEKSPKSLDVVERALMPLLTIRASVSTPAPDRAPLSDIEPDQDQAPAE